MNTRERAEALADAARHFSLLGRTTADDLLELVAAELGHREALDRFVPHGGHMARAFARTPILHIVAGNTPAAGLQTAIRGLLVDAHNLIKLPSGGLPEMHEFRSLLPGYLQDRLELATDLKPEWLDRATALVVFGSDATIAEFQRQVRFGQVFIPHGHRVSFGVVFDDPEFTSAADAARDASLFDQLGCLSPHVFYVKGDALAYARRLAAAMATFNEKEPRSSTPLSVANAIRSLREDTAFRAANGEQCAVLASDGSTDWTVIYDTAPGFPESPLHRTIFVKPLPESLDSELAPVRRHLSCAGIFPSTQANATRLAGTGVSRICPIGRMQEPPWTWHQDGSPSILSLVRWVDFEDR